MRQLRESVGHFDERVKLVLNLVECAGECLLPAEVAEMLGHTVNYQLPNMEEFEGTSTIDALAKLPNASQSTYALTVRRIARELGGVLVGLALGSGAALGLAHVGIIKVLEREGIPIDMIAGSSIGGMIGGLWAAGHSAAELETMAMRFRNPWDVRKLFMLDFGLPVVSVVAGVSAGLLMWWLTGFWAGFLLFLMVFIVLGLLMGPLIGGPIQGAQLTARLQADFEGKTFDQTRIPLKIVASNPMAREEVVFDSGSIAEAVRASVSIPGIFKPVTRFGKICLDGGVMNPVPVSVLRRFGAKRIIAVNVFPTTQELTAHIEQAQRRRAEWDAQLASRSFPVRLIARLRQEIVRSMYPLVFDVIMRSMQAMEYRIAEISCHDADLILRPTMADSHWLEFNHPEKFIQRGEEEALRHLSAMKRLVGMEPGALTTNEPPGTIKSSPHD
jgi:NTE family protein